MIRRITLTVLGTTANLLLGLHELLEEKNTHSARLEHTEKVAKPRIVHFTVGVPTAQNVICGGEKSGAQFNSTTNPEQVTCGECRSRAEKELAIVFP